MELISPEPSNGNSHIRSIDILVGGRRSHRDACLFARFSKEQSMGVVYKPLSEPESSAEP